MSYVLVETVFVGRQWGNHGLSCAGKNLRTSRKAKSNPTGMRSLTSEWQYYALILNSLLMVHGALALTT